MTAEVLSFADIWTGGGGMINDIRPSDVYKQIATDKNGEIEFYITKPASADEVTVIVKSRHGSASGTVDLDFSDQGGTND